jgi:hypothetical protein
MREILKHTPGKIFIGVLFVSIAGMLFVTRYLTSKILVLGWMTLPLFVGFVFVVVWLIAYMIYFFKFWPYK